MSWPMIFFILTGAVSLAAAVGVVASRQPIHSALFLLTHFVTLAVLYITLEAQFLAAIQVIIYAGGIVILILFVIMLIGSEEVDDPRIGSSWASITALGFGALMLTTLLYAFTVGAPGPANTGVIDGGSPYAVGITLFTEYILPIEMVAILLLVALIGALLLARQGPKPLPLNSTILRTKAPQQLPAESTAPTDNQPAAAD
jgi:NADH-quinone oxidoreductase subunit J